VEAINWEASPMDQSLTNVGREILFMLNCLADENLYGSATFFWNTLNYYYLACGERVDYLHK
jgi:hypothetical protein